MKNRFSFGYALIFVLFFVYTFSIPNAKAQVCEDANRICTRTILCENNTVLHSSDGCLTPAGCSAVAPEPCGSSSGYPTTVGNGDSTGTRSTTDTGTGGATVYSNTATNININTTATTQTSLSCYTTYADISKAFGVEQCNQGTVEAQYACVQRNMPRLEDISDWRGDCNTGKGNWSTPSGTGTTAATTCSNAVSANASSGTTLSCYTDYASVEKAFGVEQCGFTGIITPGVSVGPQYACSQRNQPRMEAISAWRGDCNIAGKGNWTGASGVGSVSTYATAAACSNAGNTTFTGTGSGYSSNVGIGANSTGARSTSGSSSQAQQLINLLNTLITKYKQIYTGIGGVNQTVNTGATGSTGQTNTTTFTSAPTPIIYTGNTSSTYINPPAVSLTANGAKDITVNVGDPIKYVWSTAATAAESSVIMDYGKADTCSGGRLATTYYPWEVFTVSGTKTANVLPCQAGTTYTVNYIALYGPNNSLKVASQVVVRVRSQIESGLSTQTSSSDFTISSFPYANSTQYIWKSLSSGLTHTVSFVITVTPKNGFQGLVNLLIDPTPQGLIGGFVTGNSSVPYSNTKQVTLSGNQSQNISLLYTATSETPLGQYQPGIVASSATLGQQLSHNLILTLFVQ